jgi:hypothetical protein
MRLNKANTQISISADEQFRHLAKVTPLQIHPPDLPHTNSSHQKVTPAQKHNSKDVARNPMA